MRKQGRKAPRRIPAVLTPDEAAQVLGEVEKSTSLSALRNLAILRLMLNTGLRARELRELRVNQIDWATGRFKVRGKGGRERVMRISGPDIFLLRRWLEARDLRLPPSNLGVPPSNLLFTNLNGTKPVCDRWLRRMVKREVSKTGIEKDVHPHTLRHSFASNLLRQEKNLFLVAKALGHSDISTTQIYLHVEDEELEEAMVRMAMGG
ncbi:Integrase [Desulfarculales bacterium]